MSCPTMIQACAMRVTRLDAAGQTIDASVANSRLQIAAFTSLQVSADIETGEEIIVKNACGDIIVRRKTADRLKGFNLTLQFCSWSTLAVEMLVGAELLLDGNGDPRGQVWPSTNDAGKNLAQIELWAVNTTPVGAGDVYQQFVLPKTSNWQMSGNLDFTNGPIQLSLGGYAEENALWSPSDEAEWDMPGDQTAIRAGGPIAFIDSGTLPDIEECEYVDVSS